MSPTKPGALMPPRSVSKKPGEDLTTAAVMPAPPSEEQIEKARKTVVKKEIDPVESVKSKKSAPEQLSLDDKVKETAEAVKRQISESKASK